MNENTLYSDLLTVLEYLVYNEPTNALNALDKLRLDTDLPIHSRLNHLNLLIVNKNIILARTMLNGWLDDLTPPKNPKPIEYNLMTDYELYNALILILEAVIADDSFLKYSRLYDLKNNITHHTDLQYLNHIIKLVETQANTEAKGCINSWIDALLSIPSVIGKVARDNRYKPPIIMQPGEWPPYVKFKRKDYRPLCPDYLPFPNKETTQNTVDKAIADLETAIVEAQKLKTQLIDSGISSYIRY